VEIWGRLRRLEKVTEREKAERPYCPTSPQKCPPGI
jgi:hypothetical protein